MGIFTVVGGAYASVEEAFFEGSLRRNVRRREAERPGRNSSRASRQGRRTRRVYKQSQPTDMTKLPKPRYDLFKVDRYASGALQYSRGCPFQCEFCDIIVIFGREPRIKRPEQVIAELDDMRKRVILLCFIVDDNFIGNKKERQGAAAS